MILKLIETYYYWKSRQNVILTAYYVLVYILGKKVITVISFFSLDILFLFET